MPEKKQTQAAWQLKDSGKCPTGIRGWDESAGGGLPRGQPTPICGGAGSGKTGMAAAFADEACRRGAPCLYATGQTPRAIAALENLKRVCRKHLEDRRKREVIDIYQQPALAKGERSSPRPRWSRHCPCPCADSSAAWQTERMPVGLDLIPRRRQRCIYE